MSRSQITLSHMMSKFSIKATELSAYFGLTRQTIYNYQLKEMNSLSKDLKSKICDLCSVNNLNEVYTFFESKSIKANKKIIKNNLATPPKKKVIPSKKSINISLNNNLTKEYVKLLEQVLNNKLSKGNDYNLLDVIDKHKK